MKQLVIYVLQGIFIGVCELIDTSFSNGLGIDSICVYSSFLVITWTVSILCSIGQNGYTVLLHGSFAGLIITVVTSAIVSILIFASSSIMPHLYALTNQQYELFTKCLKMYAFCIPFSAVGSYLRKYITLKCMNHLLWITNVIFYACMVFFDYVVISLNKDLSILICTTGLSYLIYDIIILKFSNIFQTKGDRVYISDIIGIIQHGFNMIVDRLIAKIGTFVFNIYASKLGTELYAIHCIAYSLGVTTEYLTMPILDFQVIKLETVDMVKNKLAVCKELMRKYYVPVCCMCYFVSYTLLLVIHGSIGISDCILFVGLYCTECFSMVVYFSYKGVLVSLGETLCMKYCGMLGTATRVVVVLIGFKCNHGLYSLGLASFIDYGVRALFLYVCVISNAKEDKEK